MNSEAEKKFTLIAQKELSSLTPPDIAFLKSRKDYLDKDQLTYFASVLSPKEEVSEDKQEASKKPNTKK